MVAIELPARRRLRQVKEANTRFGALQLVDYGAQLIAHAVATDQDFKVVNALCQDATHGVAQRGRVLMRGNQYADARHGELTNGFHHLSLSMYHFTVDKSPASNVSRGAQPSSL
jgi:hypothetical protein